MASTRRKVLVVDDQLESLWSCCDLLQERGYEIVTCSDPDQALGVFVDERPDVVLLDVKMPARDGLDLLRNIREKDSQVCIVMLSAYGDAKTVVSAMKMGADNFAEKGLDPEKILIVIEKELKRKEMEAELIALKAEKRLGKVGIDQVIGESEVMKRVKQRILECARSDSTVLLTGEPGVGKDLVAGVIHHESNRRDRPFEHLFCPGIPETLFQSELFGHERGSFTGAYRTRYGRIEAAGDGTVFLNEFVEIPPSVQASLLLVIETGTFTRVGGEGKVLTSRARFIGATNADISKALASGRLREDLLFRLREEWIELPPLRERGDDIILLARHFIKVWARRFNRPEVKLSDESIELLRTYDWPGNVRELRHVMRRVVMVGSEDAILSDVVLSRHHSQVRPSQVVTKGSLRERLREAERDFIAQALRRFNGNRRKTARYLEISYRSLLAKMKAYGLRHEG